MLKRNKVVEKTTLVEEIQQNSTRENKVIKELQKEDGQTQEDNGIIYMNRRIYSSNNKKIREQVLQENHDSINIEQQKILELIK